MVSPQRRPGLQAAMAVAAAFAKVIEIGLQDTLTKDTPEI
jgi:hypothetical protein